jgi:hypothetical protein
LSASPRNNIAKMSEAKQLNVGLVSAGGGGGEAGFH